jgi:hypothetical protein
MKLMINPWAEINLPNKEQANVRRADIVNPFDFFWGRDFIGNYLFIYQCNKDIECTMKAPELNGISITEHNYLNSKRIIISLKDKEQQEIFNILCCNILSATQNCRDEKSALIILYQRTWRWHQLLKKGHVKLLSKEAQKGLIGELHLLKHILFKNYSIREALSFWEGPLGSPKDFSMGSSCIEVKTKHAAAQPYISISSEFQLEHNSFANLLIYLLTISPGLKDQVNSFTLTEMIDEISLLIEEHSPSEIDDFNSKLMEIGYFSEDDYSEFLWEITGDTFYIVENGFPLLDSSKIPQGVSNLTYRIDLNSFENYIASHEKSIKIIKGNLYD